jgi:hypothetical protein
MRTVVSGGMVHSAGHRKILEGLHDPGEKWIGGFGDDQAENAATP